MRYSAAVVLSTLAVGQAAVASQHNRHASFHARRQAEAKRSAGDIDWDKVAYDLKDVDWNAVNWSSVFASPTPAATPTPTPTPEQKKPAPAPTSLVKAPAPAATSAQPAAPSAKVETTSTSSTTTNGNVVTTYLTGVADIASKLGAKVGLNSQTNNGAIWIGTDSQWQVEFTNDANKDSVIYCWAANGFLGMSINAYVPQISVGLKAGQKVNLAFASGVPAACAPAFADTTLANFGGLKQTWFEVTFGQYGTFDISRNVNMQGATISAKGSKCTSDMTTCAFQCKNGMSTCEKGADYELVNCSASNGGGGGYDPIMAGTGGGCNMASGSEKVSVVYS